MNVAAPRSFPSVPLSRGDLTPVPAPKSQTNVSPQSSGTVVHLDLIDGADFRAWFTPAFARWLQANFPNPEAVAAAFGVRYTTATNWWNADNRASGDIVMRAFLTFPQATAWFLQEWEGRS